jgi:hypothetical protein
MWDVLTGFLAFMMTKERCKWLEVTFAMEIFHVKLLEVLFLEGLWRVGEWLLPSCCFFPLNADCPWDEFCKWEK